VIKLGRRGKRVRRARRRKSRSSFWICLEAHRGLASPLFHELRRLFARLIVRGLDALLLGGARYNLATPSLERPRRDMHKQVKIATQQLPISEWSRVGRRYASGVHARSGAGLHFATCVRRRRWRSIFSTRRELHAESYFQNDVFECMTICWEIGQFQPHPQSSWQNWLDVRADRAACGCGNFAWTSATQCAVRATSFLRTRTTWSGHPAYVNPLQPVHQVLNLAEFISGRQYPCVLEAV